MKIKILEYKIFKGEHVKVQSHNKINGKWKPNPNWDFHNKVANGDTMIDHFIEFKNTKEVDRI